MTPLMNHWNQVATSGSATDPLATMLTDFPQLKDGVDERLLTLQPASSPSRFLRQHWKLFVPCSNRAPGEHSLNFIIATHPL